jgi:hypothetical protein
MKKPPVSKAVYGVVKLGYYELVMPYDDAIALITSLKTAEKYVDNYNEITKIGPCKDFKVTINILSYEEYIQYKANNLLLEDTSNEESPRTND